MPVIDHEYILLSTPRFNRIVGYQHLLHTRVYLRQCFDRFEPNRRFNKRINLLGELCGFNGPDGLTRFEQHLWEWMRGRGKLPRRFLEAMGVKEQALRFVFELDQEAYALSAWEAPMEINLFAVIAKDAQQYTMHKMPKTACINKAVEYMQAYQESNPFTSCFLHVGPLYTSINAYESLGALYRYEMSMAEEEDYIRLGHIEAITGPYQDHIFSYR